MWIEERKIGGYKTLKCHQCFGIMWFEERFLRRGREAFIEKRLYERR